MIRENQKAALKPKQTPLDFMLLIDASGSMRGYPLNEAKKACLALVDDMLDFSVHRLALASFANDVNLLLDLSQDTQAMREKISSITAYGGTDMVAALERANRQLLNSSRGKVVVMVTDGAPNWVDGTLRMAETLKSNGVRLIAIGVGSSIREDVLRKMASSGDAYKIDDMNQLEGTFRTAISAIMEKM